MRKPRSPEEVRQRREAIKDRARTLFFRRGFAATTMPQIARAARVAPGTLYLYFRNKRALYAALLVEGYDLLLAEMAEAIAAARLPAEQAAALIDAFLGFARRRPEYFDIMFFMQQREGRRHADELPAAQLRALEEREQACRALAAGVLERGALPAARVPAVVASVWTMLAGVVLYCRHDAPGAADAVFAEARRLLLASLFSEP